MFNNRSDGILLDNERYKEQMKEQVNGAISTWQRGKSLPADLYNSTHFFAGDIAWLMRSQWFLTGHVSQIPNAGDYYLFQMESESVIITRNQSGVIKAFHNTCRHRGSRVCLEQSGSKRLFTCPYHAWSYDLDGALVLSLIHI